MTDIHLTTDIRYDVSTNSDKKYIYIFSFVVLFVLLIASINFVNLSTARATLRAKEVGVRKVLGAYRRQLIVQIFSESVFMSMIAIIFALFLVELISPFVSNILHRPMNIDLFRNPLLFASMVGMGLLTGIVAGIYPAFVLSSFNPTIVIKGFFTKGVKGAVFRKSLIVVQFGVSVFLLITILIVYHQLNFMKNRDLGFNKEQVLFLNLTGPVKSHFDTFRNNLLKHPNIQQVALGSLPGRIGTSRGYNWPGLTGEEEGKSFYTMFVDEHMLDALDITLVEGRDFSSEIVTDTSEAYILNEKAVQELGWENPIGHPFRVWDEKMGRVIGVVNDFHFKSLHQEIEPLVLDIKPEWAWNGIVRLGSGNISETIKYIEKQRNIFETELPFSYRFLDTDFDRLYRSEERLGKLFSTFTFLALFVSCLGLFGLTAFTTEQRTKEIGIRKVLGASVGDILFLITKESTRLVLLAFIIVVPIACFISRSWLQNFAYRIGVDVSAFIISGLIVLALALITVSTQVIRTAFMNPGKTLRYE
jgi:putative ABC transport system permease protein